MKLSFAKTYHYIPQVTDEELLKVCKKIGIPATSMDFDASPNQIDLLKYNSELQLLGAAKEASLTHEKILSDYDTTIEKYNALISSLEGKPEFATDKVELEAIRDRLIEIKEGYSHVSTNLDVKSESMDNYNTLDNAMYDPTMSSFSRFKIAFQKSLAEVRDKQLQHEYEKLDDLTGLENIGKFSRRMNYDKIMRIKIRIAKLQRKQGKLLSSQKRIISEGSRKYIEHQAKELKTYYRNIRREEKAFAEIEDLHDDVRKIYVDYDRKMKEINRLINVDGAENRVRQLQNEVDVLRARVQDLQHKEGIVRAQNQFGRESEKLKGLGM